MENRQIQKLPVVLREKDLEKKVEGWGCLYVGWEVVGRKEETLWCRRTDKNSICWRTGNLCVPQALKT